MLLDQFFIPLFALIVFVLIYLVFKLLKVKHSLVKWRFWLSWLVLSPVLYIAFFLILLTCIAYTPSKPFSQEQWRRSPDTRIEIIDDLLRKKVLVGKTRQQVITLLGEPIDMGNGHFSEDHEDMLYYLGPERGLIGIDNEYLLIWLKDRVVVRTKATRD